MKVHLVDGTYELFRAWFGAPPATGADGTEVGASRGILRTLLVLLNDPEVTHVAVAFDHVIESFRNDLFPGYKTGTGLPVALTDQFPLAEEVSRALGLVTWPMVEFEADDALASGAARFKEAPGVEQVVLCTPDKDLAQCVEADRVVMWDRLRGKVRDERGVIEKFGVPPKAIPDYLALVGDSADGIPGIPRWGAKSTAAVLSHYGGIDAIPDDSTAWELKVRGAKTLAANLRQMRTEARLYRVLATLRTDVPLPESLGDLRWKGVDHRAMAPLLARLDYSDPVAYS
jgi:5'-3' exonuclease